MRYNLRRSATCIVCLMFALALFPAASHAQSQNTPATNPSPMTTSAETSSSTTRPTDEDAAKEADIRRLLVLTRAGEIGDQVASQMIDRMRVAMPKVPDQFWSDFQRELNPQSLVDLIVPIYARHFTHDDILQIIAFYDSPLGHKLTSQLPAIMQESMQAGGAWGEDLAKRINERLKEKGYLKA